MKQGTTYQKLGDVCEILDSKRKPITKGKREPGSIPYYGATGCLDYVKDYIFDEKLVLLGEDGAKWGPGESSAYIISGKSWVNNHAHALRPKREIILDEILVYYLNYSNLQTFITGVTVPKLNQEKMRSIEVPVAPISEQVRIVERLDAAFAQIDELKSNAEKQLAEARALFQSALTQAMQPKPGWQEKKLKEICRVINGRAYAKHEMLDEGKYRLLRVGNFFTNNQWFYSDLELEEDKYCDFGDLLYAWSASFGPRIWDGEKVIYHYHIWKMICSQEIDKFFLFYWLDSNMLKSQTMTNLHGTTMAHITKSIIENSIVIFPSIPIQKEIASNLDCISRRVKELEEICRKTAAECDAMKQALLRQIFE